MLSRAIEPPLPEAISSAVGDLQRLNALTAPDEQLTPMGYLLAKLPGTLCVRA